MWEDLQLCDSMQKENSGNSETCWNLTPTTNKQIIKISEILILKPLRKWAMFGEMYIELRQKTEAAEAIFLLLVTGMGQVLKPLDPTFPMMQLSSVFH